jgi:lantibiotic modifying enzyme
MGLFGNKGNDNQVTNDGKYTIIYNKSLEDLIKDINNMAEKGWRCVNISPASTVMYALMEKV